MNLAELSDDGTIAVQCAIAGVAAIVVLGRVYMRTIYLSSSLNLSDYFVLGGLTISLGWCITTGLAQKSSRIRDAFNTDEKLSKGLQKSLFAASLMFDVGLYFPKFSLLALYYHVVNECFRKTRIALHVITGLIVASCITVTVLDFVVCIPFSQQFSTEPGQCTTWWSWESVVVGYTLNMLGDVLVFLLPFSFLSNLKLGQKARYGLIATFALGILTIMVSTSRFVALYYITNFSFMFIMCTAEMCTAIIVVSLPIFRQLFKDSKGSRIWKSGSQNRNQVRSDEVKLKTFDSSLV